MQNPAIMEENERYMRRVFQLSKRGKGKVSPNPLVGAVIVRNGKIVGEGHHHKVGTEHAEVVAIKNAGHRAKGARMFVNLEPCCHYGRTPPCTDSIIKAGIKEIFIATSDTNPLVSGKGISHLHRSGITVHKGLLESEARQLNECYFTYMEKKRPFIILKIAQTIDGKIADSYGNSKWITSEEARKRVHSLRNNVDAILTGIGTVISDNPQLTPRFVRTGKEPLRIVLDSSLRIPLEASILRPGTIVATINANKPRKKERLVAKGVTIWEFNEKRALSAKGILKKAYDEKVQSILIEAGKGIVSSFTMQHLVDKAYFFIASKILGNGLSPFEGIEHLALQHSIPLKRATMERVGSDFLVKGYVYGDY